MIIYLSIKINFTLFNDSNEWSGCLWVATVDMQWCSSGGGEGRCWDRDWYDEDDNEEVKLGWGSWFVLYGSKSGGGGRPKLALVLSNVWLEWGVWLNWACGHLLSSFVESSEFKNFSKIWETFIEGNVVAVQVRGITVEDDGCVQVGLLLDTCFILGELFFFLHFLSTKRFLIFLTVSFKLGGDIWR